MLSRGSLLGSDCIDCRDAAHGGMTKEWEQRNGPLRPKRSGILGEQLPEVEAVGAVAELFLRSLLRAVAWQRPPFQ